MTTLADVRAACRLTIASTAIVDATLDGWIADALRFHSVQFPRRAAWIWTARPARRNMICRVM